MLNPKKTNVDKLKMASAQSNLHIFKMAAKMKITKIKI